MKDKDEEREEDLDEEDGDEEDSESAEDGKSKELSPIEKITKPIKKKIRKQKRRIKRIYAAISSFLVFLLMLVVYLTFDWFKEDVISKFQGQTEVLVVETTPKDDCFEVVLESGQSFCVNQRDFPYFKAGETAYLSEDSYGFPRLEVKKDEVRDFLR